MPHRYRVWNWVLAIGAGLFAGCGSLDAHRHKVAAKDSTSDLAPETWVDRSGARVAQAHAHFAAGVIHEMNDETEAALEEFYKAGLNDVDNEALVLDVTRRLLQNKQPEKALELLKWATARPNASGA